jgi:hypothetical protein
LAACDGKKDDVLGEEELRDPQVCAECHPDHVREWSGSMHAYAAADPLFRALEARGQRETNGELGDFCVKCHAPAAVELGLVETGADLDDVPTYLQGVTCWFCHQVSGIEGTENNPLVVARDGVMRGAIRDPVPNGVHAATYSELLDRDQHEASDLCGTCHDLVTPLGAHIERTHAEWQTSLFSQPAFGLNCGECHMPGREGVAAETDDVVLREVHDHAMPGVDTAFGTFPEQEAQKALVQDLLDDTVTAFLCVAPTVSDLTLVTVTLENVAAGHSFPSGATSDRRMWAEIRAYAGDTLIWSTGTIPPGGSVDEAIADDPNLWSFGSTLYDLNGQPTPFFWEAAAIDGNLLVAPTSTDPSSPVFVQTHATHDFLVKPGEGLPGVPDRIELELHVQPFPVDVVDELIASGDLTDPTIRDQIPTYTLAPATLTWTVGLPVNAGDLACVPEPPPEAVPPLPTP